MKFFKRALTNIGVIFLTLLFSASTYSSSQLEVGDWDIDDDGRADAFLRVLIAAISQQLTRVNA